VGFEKAALGQGDMGNHPDPIGEKGARGDEMPQEVLSQLVRVVSNHWMRVYQILGPAATTAGVVILGVSVVEMLASTAARAVILYSQMGPALWILAAAWGTTFQVVSLPTGWALEYGEQHGRTIVRHMESRVGGVDLPAAGGGPAAFN
jgi:hypothetical protein